MLQTSESSIVQALIIIESLFFLASRFYTALWLSERFWCKPQNCQLVSKSPIFKMAENHHGTHFHKWGRNSNAYNLNIVERKFYQDQYYVRTTVQKWTYFGLLIENRRGKFLKLVGFFFKKIAKIWKNVLTKLLN